MYPYNNQFYPQIIPPTVQSKREVIKVSGRAGAEAFQLEPDSSALLLDNTAPIVWLVQTDGAGYKTLKPFDIKEHEEEKPVDVYKNLEERITKLEEVINAKQSNTSNANKQRKSDNAE